MRLSHSFHIKSSEIKESGMNDLDALYVRLHNAYSAGESLLHTIVLALA